MPRILTLLPALFSLLLVTVGSLLAQPAAGRLRVASNGRYLEWASTGKPFLYLADTAWALPHALRREQIRYYLRNRAAKGFTVIQAVALPLFGDPLGPNVYGDAPFPDRNPAAPNERYFELVDFLIEEARQASLVTGLLPVWGHHWKTTRSSQPPLFHAGNARAYGEFLGKRYRNQPMIWILGGDDNPDTPAERATLEALAAGLAAGDGGAHLLTYHPRGPGLSSTYWRGATWLHFQMTQSSHAARDHDNGLYIEHDRTLSPPKPTIDGEPRYEGLHVGFYLRDHHRLIRFDDADARQAAWWAMLAGAAGHSYGNHSVWQMWELGKPPQLSASIPWQEALDHPGAFQMGLLRRLLERFPWHLLVPAQDWLLAAPREGGAKVRAAVASDGSFALVYSPQGAAFTVDQRRLKGTRLRESWFDPRYGTTDVIHTSDTRGIQTYTPPTSGRGQDWVLILENLP